MSSPVSPLATIADALLGTSPSAISQDVTAAEQAATVAYVIIAIELGVLIFLAFRISSKLS